jgi:hypothetical protein
MQAPRHSGTPTDDDHVRPDPAHRAEIPQIDLKFLEWISMETEKMWLLRQY